MSASNPEQFLVKEKQQKEKEKRVQDLLKSYYHEQQQQQQQEEEEQEQEQKQSFSKKTREIKEQNEQTNDGMKSWTKEEEKAHAGATSTTSQLHSDENKKKKNNNSSIQNKNLIEILKDNNEILNHTEIRKIAGIIREKESLAATRFFGIPDSQVHFLKLPFYETGTVKKNLPSEKDFEITKDIITNLKPHQ